MIRLRKCMMHIVEPPLQLTVKRFTFKNPRINYSTKSTVLLGYKKMLFSAYYSVSQKNPPAVFRNFFPNGWEFFNQFLHTYYTFLSTLDYKFLFNYPQL